MYVTLIIVGLIAGFLSGSVGFGGGMILLPVITYFYGVEVAVLHHCPADEQSWKAADGTRGRFDVQWADGLPTVTLSGDEMEDITVNFLSL